MQKHGSNIQSKLMGLVDILARPDDTSSRSLAYRPVASDIWLVPFKSRAPVVTEFIVKNCKKSNLKFYHFSISRYFQAVNP